VKHEGARYLVAMPGGFPGWVRNTRAAAGRAVLRHGRQREDVRLEELPARERAPLLQAWYGWTSLSPVPRRHFGLDRRAPLEAFERLAEAHPVFRIVGAAPPARSAAVGGHVTRDVAPATVGHLLRDPPRATVAFVDGGAVEVLPARVQAGGDGHAFAVAAGTALDLTGREVLLVLDGGSYWFELCGISVRGIAQRKEPVTVRGDERQWYALAPRRVLAWDYAAIREE
jgi:hypothetical protein